MPRLLHHISARYLAEPDELTYLPKCSIKLAPNESYSH